METETKAMSLQEKKRILLEQSKIDNLFWTENEFEAILRTIDSCLAAQKAELESLRSSLAASERFRAQDAMSAIDEANRLRESITQEKAKAFDEGMTAMETAYEKAHPKRNYMIIVPNPPNPYRQDK